MSQMLQITEQDENQRLDLYLAERLNDLSRSHIQKLIGTHAVLVGGVAAKANYKVRAGDVIQVEIPAARSLEAALSEDIPLSIVYEDADLIVIDKPKGMVVHPAPGAQSGTLVNALLHHCRDLSGIGGVLRPGIVHRLDKDTSGLIVVAKSDRAHASLAAQIKDRTAVRKYKALLWGRVPFKHAVIDAPIARHPTHRKRMAVFEDFESFLPPFGFEADPPWGLRPGQMPIRPEEGESLMQPGPGHPIPPKARPAVTELRLLEHLGIFSWVEAILQTGRTHQIRVHTAFAGYPVVGDMLYGGARRVSADELRGPSLHEINDSIAHLRGQALHAYSLAFTHPVTGKRVQFSAPLCPEIADVLSLLHRIDEE